MLQSSAPPAATIPVPKEAIELHSAGEHVMDDTEVPPEGNGQSYVPDSTAYPAVSLHFTLQDVVPIVCSCVVVAQSLAPPAGMMPLGNVPIAKH